MAVRDRLAHLTRHRRVEDRHDQPHVGVVADEQRHPQRERVLARGHAGDVDVARQQRALHGLVVGVDQEAHGCAARFERLAHLLGEVALAHQEHAHTRADLIRVWRDLRVRHVR